VASAPVSTLASLGRFSAIPEAGMSGEQRAVVKSFMDRRGMIPAPFQIFLSSAPLADRLRNLSDYVLRNGLLSKREVETAVLVTAHHLRAKFVETAHRRIAAEAGLPAETIEAILAGRDPRLSDAREQAVYECAVAMHQGRQNAGFAKVTKILGNDGVCEVAAILGFYCTCGFVLGFFEVPPRT
jgi:4-carboxymuconolactone decarboxylase